MSAANQSPGLPETLATAHNTGMCLLALPVICFYANDKEVMLLLWVQFIEYYKEWHDGVSSGKVSKLPAKMK